MLSNNPPEGEALTLRLQEMHASLVERTDELTQALARVPATLDETTHDKAAAFVKQMKLHAKKVSESRVAEKEPYLEGGRVIDGWFGKMSLALDAACKQVEARITAFLKAKAEAERKAREEEARKAREAAEALERQLNRMPATVEAGQASMVLDAAVDAAVAASAAEDRAAAPVADLARTRTAYGVTSSLRTEVAFEITHRLAAMDVLASLIDEEAIHKAARKWVSLNKSAAENIIAGKAEPLPGIRLFHNQIARVA